ncbi:terpenoid synthase [Ascobolus immersus RN42]|uniref:Terpenoid synthase n=1 Tax=Ascobolus immersus RN42 TaxID=1160509 RepID=A0A3N4HL74_ASCIM|nr:terpenoid synthase [Ascobolus immersus RN42]
MHPSTFSASAALSILSLALFSSTPVSVSALLLTSLDSFAASTCKNNIMMPPMALDAILADIPSSQAEFLQRQRTPEQKSSPLLRSTSDKLHHTQQHQHMGTKRKIGMVDDIEHQHARPEKTNGVAAETQTHPTQTDGPSDHGDGARLLAGMGHSSTPASESELARIHELPWSEENQKILLGPYDYLVAHPGKDIRKKLIDAFNHWLQVPPETLTIISRVVAMLHTSSLLIDDVEDNSLLRRGVPVAHGIFGIPQTINSANYVYFLALQEVTKLGRPELLQVFTEELLNLHRGQGLDLFWRDSLTCPTEDDYLSMVSNKTGGLFRLAVKLMQGCSTSTTDYVPLVNLIGLIFQIRDDYLNLQSSLYAKNKGFAEDLTEGKFSFPIIHAIRTDPSNRQLLNIIKQKSTDADVKMYAVRYMKEKTRSFEYTRGRLEGLQKMAEEVVAGLEENQGIREILAKLRLEPEES